MNPELQALVLALDAVIEARAGEDAKRLEAIYQSKLEDVLCAILDYPALHSCD
jgi:hypothetical protein